MTFETTIYVILIALAALSIAYFQYLMKAKRTLKFRFLFAFLRFLSIFILGLLLLNPTFKQVTSFIEKPHLVVAIDDSASTLFLKKNKEVLSLVDGIKQSPLSEKFNISYYTFGQDLKPLQDSLSFQQPVTNIAGAIGDLKELYNGESMAPTILVTDGNQTFGTDYVINAKTYDHPIYPVIVGDSIKKTDLKIAHVQHNKYAFLGNEFPVEISMLYTGNSDANSVLTIYAGNQRVYRENISFSPLKNVAVSRFNLKANAIGKHNYRAEILPEAEEESIINNSRRFTIDVIDERTKVLVITDIWHPDLGMLNKAISANKQRAVTIIDPMTTVDLNEYQLVVLYQPTREFDAYLNKIKEFNKNYWLISGVQTDWSYLNQLGLPFRKNPSRETQEYGASYNDQFTSFQFEQIQIDDFPPLLDFYGEIVIDEQYHSLLDKRIGNVTINEPLWAFIENGTQRISILTGEGLWRWRMQEYIQNQAFSGFDELLGKTVQYLASNTKKERLVVEVQDFYNVGQVKVDAQYFDKNYVLDKNASINCTLIHKETQQSYTFDFLFKRYGYRLDLNQLPFGKYEYQVKVKNTSLSKKGTFEIIDFKIEEQFLNPDVTKLTRLATNTINKTYFIDHYSTLLDHLKSYDGYKSIQKNEIKESSIIEWEYLLGLLILLLSIEWFLRKFSGLI